MPLARRSTPVRTLRAALIMLAALSVPVGCASRRSDALSLATRGGDVATSISESFIATSQGLDLLIDRETLLARLDTTKTLPPPSATMVEHIDRVQESLTLRAHMLADVGDLYDAFARLASYNATAEVEARARDLVGSVNAFAGATNQAVPIPPAGVDLIGRLAGALATADQNGRLHRSSAIIRELLAQVRALLAGEERVHASIREEMALRSGDVAAAMLIEGLAVPHPLLQELLSSTDLQYDDDRDVPSLVASGASAASTTEASAAPGQGATLTQLGTALVEIIERRARDRATAEQMIVAATIRALETLEREHAEFEAGRPIDLQSISNQIASLRGLVEAITPVAAPQ